MSQITPELMMPMVANAFDRQCSDDELRQEISFFESETGKTYVRVERIKMNVILGESNEEPPKYSVTDEDNIVVFEASCVGRLVTSQDPTLRAVVKEAMRPKLNTVFDQCKKVR